MEKSCLVSRSSAMVLEPLFCEVLLRYLHSRPVISAKYPNASFNQHLGGLLCIWEEMKIVNNKQIMCFVFWHNDFEGIELHCVQ